MFSWGLWMRLVRRRRGVYDDDDDFDVVVGGCWIGESVVVVVMVGR